PTPALVAPVYCGIQSCQRDVSEGGVDHAMALRAEKFDVVLGPALLPGQAMVLGQLVLRKGPATQRTGNAPAPFRFFWVAHKSTPPPRNEAQCSATKRNAAQRSAMQRNECVNPAPARATRFPIHGP